MSTLEIVMVVSFCRDYLVWTCLLHRTSKMTTKATITNNTGGEVRFSLTTGSAAGDPGTIAIAHGASVVVDAQQYQNSTLPNDGMITHGLTVVLSWKLFDEKR
jgi:hypothetical protein